MVAGARRLGRAPWVAAASLLVLVGLSACGGDDDAAAGPGALAPTSTPSSDVGASDGPSTGGSTPSESAGGTAVSPTPTAPTTPNDDAVEPGPGPSSQEVVLGSLPGDTSGACVDADEQRDVRSGGIAAGAFNEAAESYVAPGGDDIVSLYWIPEHADDLSGLTVRGTQVSGGDASFVHDESTVSELIGDTGEWRYYLTDITIPAPGTWRLEATSGEDTGCFTITFGG